MFWKEAGYAALCVFVPVLWGVAVFRISSVIEKHALRHPPRTPQASGEDAPGLPLDYHI